VSRGKIRTTGGGFIVVKADDRPDIYLLRNLGELLKR